MVRYEGGKDFGGGAQEDFAEGVGVEGFLGAYVDGADAGSVGDVDEAGGGVDGAGGAYDEEGGGAVEFAVDAVHVERDLAKPDDVGTDGAAAGGAGRDVALGLDLVEGLVGKRIFATDAAGLEEGSVHVVDALGTGALVEVVDVLGAEVEAAGGGEGSLDSGEGEVAGIGLGSKRIAAAHGVETPDERGVGIPGSGSGDVFDAVAVP